MPYKYTLNYSPSSKAMCKICGQKIQQGSLRITRESDPIAAFNDHGVTNHFHLQHAFTAMKRGFCTSRVITSPKSIKGFNDILPKDQKRVLTEIKKFQREWNGKCPNNPRSASQSRSKSKSRSLLRKSRSRSKSTTFKSRSRSKSTKVKSKSRNRARTRSFSIRKKSRS